MLGETHLGGTLGGGRGVELVESVRRRVLEADTGEPVGLRNSFHVEFSGGQSEGDRVLEVAGGAEETVCPNGEWEREGERKLDVELHLSFRTCA